MYPFYMNIRSGINLLSEVAFVVRVIAIRFRKKLIS